MPLAILLMICSSCSRNEEVIALSKGFFYSLADTTYAHPHDYYPQYDSLNIVAKSDMVEIEESDVKIQGDTIVVRCFNNYTAPDGTFKQDDIYLYFVENKEGQLYICNSRGLVIMDKDLKSFGMSTGAITSSLPNDIELAKRCEQIKSMWLREYFDVYLMLHEKVKIQRWSWETSYSGEAHGEGRVVNNLDFAIEGIKYELTYYDHRGDFMANDDGSISKTLYPGEKYNFTFWSSNAKYPDKANLRLVFPDKLVYKIIMDKTYTGQEYMEYIDSLKEERKIEEAQNT